MNYSELDLQRIARALECAPTAAYTAPHDYPHGAPNFRHSPGMERERVASDVLRLYLHIPFCNYACSFCCYAKRVGVDHHRMQRYVNALKTELEWVAPGTPVNQFFMGGGTPTALPVELLDQVLDAIATRMPYDGTGVHTVETSPESMTGEHLAVLQKHGVGRISMGIQSLKEEVLDAVKRDHDQQLALDTCRRVIDGGMIMNIDLMYGLPGQRHEDFARDFDLVAEQGVHAITAYNLRLNDMTSVQRNLQPQERFDLPRLMAWRELVRTTAAQHGFTQTRWHTFKRMDSIAARHERLPVASEDLTAHQLGVGMGARSSLGHTLYRNHSKLSTYMDRVEAGVSPVEEHISLNREDLKTQFIARTLGDGKGLSSAAYEAVFNTPFYSDYAQTLDRLHHAGLLSEDGDNISLSTTGQLVYDLVMLSFYPAHAQKWLNDHMQNYQLLAREA
jgi:oxygen-independent coproporphyrinogen-3 oxidase